MTTVSVMSSFGIWLKIVGIRVWAFLKLIEKLFMLIVIFFFYHLFLRITRLSNTVIGIFIESYSDIFGRLSMCFFNNIFILNLFYLQLLFWNILDLHFWRFFLERS